MANLLAVYSVGASMIDYLDQSYRRSPLHNNPPCTFSLLSSGELAESAPEPTKLSLLLHRVTINEHLRNVPQINGTTYRDAPLALDLHYLMTVWAPSADIEHLILVWAMRELHQHQMLDRSFLSREANWGAEESVQIIPADLSNEDIMRIWDSLKPSYRLSVAYVARVVRIDPDTVEESRPVVATRIGWGDAVTSQPSGVAP
jgi:Pvc16 N-terminal domain